MINNKKWILLSILSLTAATVRTSEVQLEEYSVQMGTTVLTGAATGAFTGYAIGYLSGEIFDATIVQAIRLYFGKDYYTTVEAPIIAIGRMGTKILCKYIWEKPLRNKIINWIIEDMKEHSVPCNEELMKTIARVTSYMGCITA